MTPRKITVTLNGCICGDPACDIPFGYCHCRCGGAVNRAIMNNTKNGSIRGEYQRFKKGHRVRLPPKLVDASPFKLRDEYCRLIPLSQGLWTIISECMYAYLMQWKWYACWNKTTSTYYAMRNVRLPNGKQGTLLMHRFILGLEIGDPDTGDHIDTKASLDNSLTNLRLANYSQQACNKGKSNRNTSGYKGVSFHKGTGKWSAVIMVRGKYMWLGLFATPELAYAAYCAAAIKYHGEFARLA